MKKVLFVGFLTIAISITGIYFINTSTAAPKKETAIAPGGSVQFMGPEFAKLLCDGWNNSVLPSKLAATDKGGNGWIATGNANMKDQVRNKQVMIISRRDCAEMPRVQITIENKDGKAICTYGGAQQESYQNAEWAFAPKTVHWYEFGSGEWGSGSMWKIMSGFRGPMMVAAKNITNFGIFWQVAGKIAKDKNADYKTGCSSLGRGDIKDIEKYLKAIN